MDINKEVDRLDKAVKRYDIDTALEADSNLAMQENLILEGLESFPREHEQTINFYFKDWIMNIFDEIIFIAMIVFAFNIENQLFSIILGGLGALLLVGKFLSQFNYSKFVASDLRRMRAEKIHGNNYKMQLNYIRSSRQEHAKFLENAVREKMKDDPHALHDMLGNIFGNQSFTQEIEDNENQKSAETKSE